MSRIAVITKPRSRRNRRDPRLVDALRAQLGPEDVLLAPADLESLDAVAAGLRADGVGLVAVNGGDGTVHKVLTALWRAWGDAPLPPIALLCGGTMNTIAHGLGGRGRPDRLLAQVVRRHAAGDLPLAPRTAMIVDDAQVGFLFGTGLIARFLERYYEGAEPSPTKAGVLLARAVASTLTGGAFGRWLRTPQPCRVQIDGQAWLDGAFATIGAGTVDDIGLGFRPFPRCLEQPGSLHAVAIEDVVALITQLHRVYGARPLTSPRTPNRVGATLCLQADEPIAYMVDGDFHRGGQAVTVRAGPEVPLVALRA